MHRLLARAPLTALLLAVLVAAPGFGQVWKGKGRLQGLVIDESGKPVQGATVTLRMQENPDQGPEQLTTDKKGRWSILGLVLGMWTVHIQAPGFDISQGVVQVNEYGVNPVVKTEMKKPAVDPKMAQARAALERADALLHDKKAAEARAEYESALPVLEGDNRVLVLKRIAFCQMVEGNDAGAVDTLKSALADSPNDAEAIKLLVDRLVVLHREDEAKEYTARLPEGEGLSANTLLNLGINAYNDNQLDDALAKFNQVVAAKPDLPDGYYYRGLAYLASSKSAEAKADFEKVLALDPNFRYASECRDFLKNL